MPVDPSQIPVDTLARLGFDEVPGDTGLFFAGDSHDRNEQWQQCNDAETDYEAIDFSGWLAVAEVLDSAGAVLFDGTVSPAAGDATGIFRVQFDSNDTIENPGSHTWRLRIGHTAQVSTVSIEAPTDGTFTVTINGTPFTFDATISTAIEIRDGLIAAIDLGSEPVTNALVDDEVFSLTADEEGVPFTLSVTHSTTPASISESTITSAVRRSLICAPFVIGACA